MAYTDSAKAVRPHVFSSSVWAVSTSQLCTFASLLEVQSLLTLAAPTLLSRQYHVLILAMLRFLAYLALAASVSIC